ncbi:MAG: hypothetical protein IJ188_02465 [Clostridia bacterium]|nr:hypothetical protein [Clostridia bacterium]
MTGTKPCLKCLLRDLPEEATLAANLQELISQIPEEDRALQPLAQERLAACRSCPWLRRGTCGLCGCFVEHRAEKKKATCPDSPPRWKND